MMLFFLPFLSFSKMPFTKTPVNLLFALPGGQPGSCALGRDPQSVDCARCLPQLHETEETCESCTGGNYVALALEKCFKKKHGFLLVLFLEKGNVGNI